MKLQFVEMSGFRGFRETTRFELASGFTILSGRNGTGKSTLLDAIDYALTGTINKFSVKEAKGGGLQDHIWWVGEGAPPAHYVSVGFIDENRKPVVITRSRERGCDTDESTVLGLLCAGKTRSSIDDLMQTTLIRDELIAALSLDLPEQARFAAVRAAIGGIVGPNYSERTTAILAAANSVKIRQDERIKEMQTELSRTLGEVTEARSAAEKSSGIADALHTVESLVPSLPTGLAERTEAVRKFVAERRFGLQEIERARLTAQELLPEIKFFQSPAANAEIEVARNAQEAATKQKALADENLALAQRLEAAEQAGDEYASHLTALLNHGSAVGLQQGHCPLCDAARDQTDFDEAITRAKDRLADRGKKITEAATAVAGAQSAARAAEQALIDAQSRYAALEGRKVVLQKKLDQIQETYARYRFDASVGDPQQAQALLFTQRNGLVQLERALSVLESSNAVDRVRVLEARINALRSRSEQEAARLAVVEKSIEAARQIDNAAKTVANEILTEQFDTVMPLLKELYRRLRPHADWAEIESDFGGKIRGSLNFTVGDGYNPQFLFSSGQRRAAGLAFLLAIHLSRPWCRWQSLLMDDPVQHIDDYRALNLVEVLAAIRRSGRQVIVAVEDVALAGLLCRRLRSAHEDAGRHFELRTSTTGTAQIGAVHDIYPMPRLVLQQSQAS